MSTNYPNAALETLGYVPLEDDKATLLRDAPFESSFEPKYTFNNSLWFVEQGSGPEFRLAKTTDGSLFEFYSPGTNMSWIENGDFLILNDQIIVLTEESLNGWNSDGYYKIGISADGQTWNTYTNNLYGKNIDSRFVWNNALYVFIRSGGYNVIARSTNGIDFTTVYSKWRNPGDEAGIYASDSYIFYTLIDEMYGSSTNIYSSNGIDWQPVPNGNIEFVPDDDAFINHNGVLWAVDETEYEENSTILGEAELMKSLDGGITWTEVIELYANYQDSYDDNELSVAGGSVWLSMEKNGDLYTITSEDTLNLEINGSSGDSYYVSELANSSVLIVHEKDETMDIYHMNDNIKYNDGLYYYIKE